jgi:acyl transferase domain-containing protein
LIVDDIAVVGCGALLPDAEGIDAFWRNLLAGHCAIREVPAEIWEKRLYVGSDPQASVKSCSA